MRSAVCLHAINDHEAVVLYDQQPYLIWLPATTGLARGKEIARMSVYVSGTQTITVPGAGSRALTVLVAVGEQQIESAIGGGSASSLADQSARKWTSGKFTIVATLVGINGEDVTIKTEAGKEIVVPRAKLSVGDRDYLDAFDQ